VWYLLLSICWKKIYSICWKKLIKIHNWIWTSRQKLKKEYFVTNIKVLWCTYRWLAIIIILKNHIDFFGSYWLHLLKLSEIQEIECQNFNFLNLIFYLYHQISRYFAWWYGRLTFLIFYEKKRWRSLFYSKVYSSSSIPKGHGIFESK